MVRTKILVLHFCFNFLNALEYENIYGPRYGADWLLMTDEDGEPVYVNLTQKPAEAETRAYYDMVFFYLYTRENPVEPEELTITDGGVNSSRYKPAADLKVITHGWMSHGDTDWILAIKDAYLSLFDTNVIAVDWSRMSHSAYTVSRMSTRKVGRQIAGMMTALSQSYGTGGDQTHLIGHSLGGHIMGYAGYFAEDQVARITGLDPAKPYFETPRVPASERLDPGDAAFVDVIHTCGGLLGCGGDLGHADFYPNGGRAMQPGCDGVQYVVEGCSHGRSHQFFAESIRSAECFAARACDSWDSYERGACGDATNRMGQYADPDAPGAFYLRTNAEPSFCKD